MFKNWEMALYFLTGLWCMVIGITGWGEEMSNAVNFMARGRIPFYLVEAVLLTIVFIRSRKLLKEYDSDYFETTNKLLRGSEVCFVMIIIVTVFAVAGAIPTFIMTPQKVFFEGGAVGLFVLLLFTALIWAFYNATTTRYHKVIEKKAQTDNPPSEKLEDFFAFIHSPEEKQEQTELLTDTDEEMPDVSALLEEALSAEGELRHIPITDHVSEPAQLWECPICGSLNPANSPQCDFCGTDRKS